jgi:hypothetical protein
MTTPVQENTSQSNEQKNDKEYNFRALEAKYERQLAHERNARLEAEKLAQESQKRKVVQEDEDDDSDPYVDNKKLAKKLSSFERRLEETIDKKAEEKARQFLKQDKQESWMKQNPDFYNVMQHAQAFAEADPDLAETILEMPEGFERQKLVYKAIKAMGVHQPKRQEPSIQEKIDANRKSPYYQPSQMGTAPYSHAGDFSPTGQKNAYDKMQELKSKLRL